MLIMHLFQAFIKHHIYSKQSYHIICDFFLMEWQTLTAMYKIFSQMDTEMLPEFVFIYKTSRLPSISAMQKAWNKFSDGILS